MAEYRGDDLFSLEHVLDMSQENRERLDGNCDVFDEWNWATNPL
jgi:hypothetical protein